MQPGPLRENRKLAISKSGSCPASFEMQTAKHKIFAVPKYTPSDYVLELLGVAAMRPNSTEEGWQSYWRAMASSNKELKEFLGGAMRTATIELFAEKADGYELALRQENLVRFKELLRLQLRLPETAYAVALVKAVTDEFCENLRNGVTYKFGNLQARSIDPWLVLQALSAPARAPAWLDELLEVN